MTVRTKVVPYGALVLLAVLLAASPHESRAADVESEETRDAPPSDWNFTVIPYLWLPAVHGNVGTRGRSVAVNVDLDDVFNLIGDGKLLAGMGFFEARYRRLSLFLAAIGGTARPTSQTTFGPQWLAALQRDGDQVCDAAEQRPAQS